jgi:heme exporter protein D
MHWNSFADFVHMGGYGLYVWGSYAAALVVMVIEPLLAVQRRRRALANVDGLGGAGELS